MKVLVTGVNGQLGHDVLERLKAQQIECLGVGRLEFDLTNEKETEEFILGYHPQAVIHCAAYTAVDQAEIEKELCTTVNVIGTGAIARACRKIDAKLIYISTDYVFNGRGEVPFETDVQPLPINYYGKTKFEGELEVKKVMEKYFIIRTSWVFGCNGNNFVKTMLRLGKDKKELSVVSDQVGSPTYTWDLAKLIVEMVVTEKYGIYHGTNEGYCSWYEFACEIFRQTKLDVKVIPIKSEDYPTKAVRPKNSRLSKDKLEAEGFNRLPAWQDALRRYLLEI
ncbi:MAG: dTDP-4-dehydrorhamnose reductase [Eubacteriaceae bacterium]|nr:dTDP-4-dehydrorhamnose reductase [Eubacteriaceae bacterium]